MMYPQVSSIEDKIAFKSKYKSAPKWTVYVYAKQTVGNVVQLETVTPWGTNITTGLVYQCCHVQSDLYTLRIVSLYSRRTDKREPVRNVWVGRNRHKNEKAKFISITKTL